MTCQQPSRSPHRWSAKSRACSPGRVVGALGVAAVCGTMLAGAVTSATAGVAPSAPRPVADTRPNIVLITADDQAVSEMFVLDRVRSQLGDRGTTFANSFSPFPLCCPDRATLLTGQYAHNHGVLGNGSPEWPDGGYEGFDDRTSLATWLQDAGYWTAFVGKYLNNYGNQEPYLSPPGWSGWHATVAGGNYQATKMLVNGTVRDHSGQYQTDVYADIATNVITRRAAGDSPFFLWTSYNAPHNGRPVEPDDPINVYGRNFGTPAVADRHRDAFAGLPLPQDPSFNEYDVSDKPVDVRNAPALTDVQVTMLTELYQQRLEALLALDEAVAQTVDALRAAGELDNTIIAFTSDNGYLIGQHRVPQGKVLPYEPSLRVPLLIRGPGFPAGATRDQLVGAIDLAPTFVDAADAVPGLVLDGTSLLPIAADPVAGPDRDIVVEAGPKTIGGPMYYTGLRTEDRLYVEYASGDVELYDLVNDPLQLRSLHDKRAFDAEQAQLAARLELLRSCSGPGCREG